MQRAPRARTEPCRYSIPVWLMPRTYAPRTRESRKKMPRRGRGCESAHRLGDGCELVEVVDVRAYGAVPAAHLRVRRLDHQVLVGRVRAAAVAEAEVARRQPQRRVREDVAGVRAA